ncbi:MAG: dTDP-4-amino-4,6-dideoxygalactose transaminase [Planctomycetota bacterium]
MPSDESFIPLQKPWLGAEEERAAVESLRSGRIGGGGPAGAALARLVEETLGVKRALAMTSCTHALEAAMLALEVGPGDEVVCPSFAFVSAANAIVLRGAKVIFADIEEETLGLDPADVETRITERTRGIVLVHYGGFPCRIDEIIDLARRRGLFVVEDAAQVFGATWDGKPLGTFGDIGCFSLHETKNLTCGEGGIFVTNDEALFLRAEVIREKGTDRSRFLRGEAQKYLWQSPGSSFVLADPLCAIAIEQIRKSPEIKRRRGEIYGRYLRELAPLEKAGKLRLPRVLPRASPNWHVFYVLLDDPGMRSELIAHLAARRISAAFHFVPLHTSPFGKKLCGAPPELPLTDRIASALLRLPIYPGLLPKEQDRVIGAVFDFLG